MAAAGAVPGVPGLPGLGVEGVAPIELPEQDRIAAALVSGNRWLVILSLFGAGLLLTFTPCVLPMVPILTSIIVGQGTDPHSGVTSSRRAFMLSFVYVLAMALTYTVAGVLAGLFGANLAAAFQDPWILSGFALVFVLLALSMFGFYDLQIPASWQARLTALSHRQRGGTYAGVGVMGALSALIVSPCVAAPLAGVLIYIGHTGDPVLGGVALFALGMGMGVPLIVAGVSAGKLLPKVGAWMDAVKAVFGVMLLAVAIYLLERIVPETAALLLWAALLIVCSIYMGALDSLTAESGGWRRLWKGAGLVMLVYGVLVMVGVAGGRGDLLRPLKGIALVAGEGAEREIVFRRVKGIDGLNAELGPAAARGQVVMFDYYADWCVSCKEMERFTFSDPKVQAALSNVLLLQTDVTTNDAADKALLEEFGLFGPPAILFFGPDGRERRELRVVGFMNAGDFRRVVERAVSPADAGFQEASLLAVTPDGQVTLAAPALRFPNGAVITPDGGTLVVAETFGRRLTAFDIGDDGALSNRRVWAELGVPPDGICLDAEGCIWVAVPRPGGFLRVAEGGDVRARVDLEGWGGYACMLGGDEGRTLFLLEALTATPEEMSGRGNGRIRTMEVDAPRAGLP